jgi:hypothetical protein
MVLMLGDPNDVGTRRPLACEDPGRQHQHEMRLVPGKLRLKQKAGLQQQHAFSYSPIQTSRRHNAAVM